ncbi:unnamed protein product [Schistosoma margrebowiei]|uniref:Uncharacterized protein n=1 Tax=Schistosoma margrebowiei TaxID=48269 RepID=A0A183MVI8_9TREM|nr:unnamed protein product [Schistosoma margrebowiei]
MRTSISERKHGIQWTAQNQLDDLDFADDPALLSHTHGQMQTKTASVAAVSASLGLSIHKGKTKILKFKAENSNPITLDGETTATAFCGIEQINFQIKKKLGKDDGSG